MRFLALLLALYSGSMTSTQAAWRDYVVLVDQGCSGVLVSPQGHVLTAKHCEPPAKVVVRLADGRRVSAERVYVDSDVEGVVVFDCEGDGYPALRISESPPVVESTVLLCGYRNADPEDYQERQAEVLGAQVTNSDRYSNYKANVVGGDAFPGMSGGPAVDSAGAVVGLVSAGSPGRTMLVRHNQIVRALAGKPTLVAFVTTNCRPCELFLSDHRGGAFSEFNVEVVNFDGQTGTWSDGGTAFKDASAALAKIPKAERGFPTFWVRGTTEAKVGYREQRGLIQWVFHAFDTILKGIFGGNSGPPQFPTNSDSPGLIELGEMPVPPDTAEQGEVERLRQQIGDLREKLVKAIEDVKQFKEAGIIGKIGMIDDLMRDKDEIVADVKDARLTAENIMTDPLPHLWSLILGLAGGLLKKRFT